MAIRPVAEMVADAKARIESMPLDEARARAEAGEIQLVDIRDVRELDRDGRIPGAIHAPRGMLEFWIDPASKYYRPALTTEKKLVLFCAGAQRSALAVAALADMGVENIAEMEGGFSAWSASGAPVERRG